MQTLDQAMASLFPAPRYSYFGEQIHLAQFLGTAQFAECFFFRKIVKKVSPQNRQVTLTPLWALWTI